MLYDPLKCPFILDCYWHEKVISPIWFRQLHCAGVPEVTAHILWVSLPVGQQIAQFLKAAPQPGGWSVWLLLVAVLLPPEQQT